MPGALVPLAAALAVAAAPAPAVGRGYIFLPLRGGVSFDVEVDTATIVSANEHEAQIVDMRGDLVTMVDSYASRPEEGGGCKDGREIWVRLLDLATKRERSATLAGSCHRRIIASDPVVTWKADGSGYSVNVVGAAPIWVPARG